MKALKLSCVPLTVFVILLLLIYLTAAFTQWDLNAGNWPVEFRENMTIWVVLSIVVSLILGVAVIKAMLEED